MVSRPSTGTVSPAHEPQQSADSHMDWLDNVLATEHSQQSTPGEWGCAHDLPVRCDAGPISSRGSIQPAIPVLALQPEAEQRPSVEAGRPDTSRRRSRASLGQELLLADGAERSTDTPLPDVVPGPTAGDGCPDVALSLDAESLHQPPPLSLPRLALASVHRSVTDPTEAMVATPELRDAAAMLLEGAQGCGSARNAAPCKLPRSSRSEMLEYDVEAFVAAGDGPPSMRLTKDKDRIVLSRNTQARLEMLGPDMPFIQVIILWIALVCDIASKVSVVHTGHYWWAAFILLFFAFILLFFVLSSVVSACYWATHYPGGIADQAVQMAALQPIEERDRHRRIIRWGMFASLFQLGSAYAAARALFSNKYRQRLVAMDLRGLRLLETSILSMAIAVLQTYIGMSCRKSADHCLSTTGGFDFVLCSGIITSLIAATLCFVTFEFNDLRLKHDITHLYSIVSFFIYRLLELCARVTVIALFACFYPGWVFAILSGHALSILLLLRYSPLAGQDQVWKKVTRTTPVRLGLLGCSVVVKLPKLDDVKLVALCLAWLPSAFISDVTASSGKFWWRCRKSPRRSGIDLRLGFHLVPFPIFVFLLAAETSLMLGLIWHHLAPWGHQFFGIVCILQTLWLLGGTLFSSISLIIDASFHQMEMDAKLQRDELLDRITMTMAMGRRRTSRTSSHTGTPGSSPSKPLRPSAALPDLLPAQRHRRSPSKVMSPRYVGNINGQAVPFTNAFGDDKVLMAAREDMGSNPIAALKAGLIPVSSLRYSADGSSFKGAPFLTPR